MAGVRQLTGEAGGDLPEVGEIVGAADRRTGGVDPGEVHLCAGGRRRGRVTCAVARGLIRRRLHLERMALHVGDLRAHHVGGVGAEPGVDAPGDHPVKVAGLERGRPPARRTPVAPGLVRDPARPSTAEPGPWPAAGDGRRAPGRPGRRRRSRSERRARCRGGRGARARRRRRCRCTRRRACPVAAEVGAYDTVSRGRQRGDLRVPHAAVADGGVEQDEGGAVAGQVVGERHGGSSGRALAGRS